MVRARRMVQATLTGALFLLASCSPEEVTGPGAPLSDLPLTVQASHADVSAFLSDVWIKEPGIRLELGPEDPASAIGIHTPYVFRFPDGTLRMYYDAFNSEEMKSAVSTDGLVWAKEEGVRLSGAFFHPNVVATPDGRFRMYVEKATRIPTVESAISDDGLTWTLETGPRIGGVDPVVLELPGGAFRLYYRSGFRDFNIRSAFSSDGLLWTSEPGIRIANTREFAVIRMPDGTVVIYYGKDGAVGQDFKAILSARSSNGLDFVPAAGERLLPGNHPTDAPLDDGKILTTSILQFPGGVVRMYYQGSPDPNASINLNGRVFSAVVSLEPEARIDAMILEIENLVAYGELSEDQGAGLLDKLTAVLAKLDGEKTKAAIGQLRAFRSQVTGLINAGQLSSELGQPYIDAADELISQIEGGA